IKGRLRKTARAAEIRLYDRLFTEAHPDSADDFTTVMNRDSKRTVTGYVEPAVAEAAKDERFQFERTGYFVTDRVDHTSDHPVLNLAVGLRDGGQVVLHVVLLDELGVVGHILDIVGDGDNAAAGDIRSFSVDLGDDVGGSAGRNGQGNLIGVVGVVNDGQFQMDVGGILDGLKDALADPLVVHGIGGVVVEEHRVGDRLVRVEVLAVLIAEVRLVRSSGVGGSSAVGGACSRGAAGAAAGSQRQHHAGSQHEGCELFHVS
ncbi:MAG: hypothetical protein EGQ67_06955, partial [Clostridiales bacterium]|nr:hypothetical protein [Clostridiales bacterium]